MKTLAKVILLTLLSAGLAQAAAFEKVAASSSTQVTLVSEEALAVGNNKLKFILSGEQYSDADVAVKVFMPAMPGMPAMQSKVTAKSIGNGVYEAQINFSMRGTWQVHIFITPKTGKKIRVKTSLNI